MPLFEVNDFSGGMTDNYMEGNPRMCQKAENLLINEYKELFQRGGFVQYDDFSKQIPAGNQRIDSCYVFNGYLFVKSGTALYLIGIDGVGTTWSTLAGPNVAAFPLSGVGVGATWHEWRGHLFITPGYNSTYQSGGYTVKVYQNGSSVWKLFQAGLPGVDALAGSQLVTIARTGTPVSGSSDVGIYRYMLAWQHTYTAKVDGNDVEFIDYGHGSFCGLAGGTSAVEHNSIDGSNYHKITAGKLAANDTYENYPVADMEIGFWRTTKNGFIPKFVDSFASSTLISDNGFGDASLGADFYIGDLRNPVLLNHTPPRCFATHLVDSRMYYIGILDIYRGDVYFDRIMESKAGDLDSVPLTNFASVGDRCSGIGNVGVFPIVGTENMLYRIEGHFDSYGSGGMRPRVISKTEGIISQRSVVNLKDSMLFASKNGFCWTDGFKVINLTEKHLLATYKALLNKENIYGVHSPKDGRVFWSVCTLTNYDSGEQNEIWVYDARFGSAEGPAITTMRSVDGAIKPTSLCWNPVDDVLLIGEHKGYILQMDENATTDLIMETSGDLDTFETIWILPHYISSAIKSSRSTFSVWVSKIFGVFNNIDGGLSVDVEGYDDDSGTAYSLNSIRQRSITGIHRFLRGWKSGKCRSHAKQFGVKKGIVNLVWSDDYDTATISSSTVTIDSGSWPTYDSENLVGHNIYFDTDAYVTGYEITAQSGVAITLGSAPGNAAGVKWEVKGVPKNEGFNIESLAVDFQILGMATRGNRPGNDGGNS